MSASQSVDLGSILSSNQTKRFKKLVFTASLLREKASKFASKL